LKGLLNGKYVIVVEPSRAERDVPFDLLIRTLAGRDGSGTKPLLPDLVALRPERVEMGTQEAQCRLDEMLEDGAMRCLRFDQIIANVGDGPLEVRYRWPDMLTDPQMFQRFYAADGTWQERSAGDYEFHASHGHFHLKAFALSRLWPVASSGRSGMAPLRQGLKNGFCLMDVQNPWFGRRISSVRRYFGSECDPSQREDLLNGISVGWADRYNYHLPGQYIEVTGVEDGRYILETIVDPENRILEQSEENNSIRTFVEICDGQAGRASQMDC
jgi:hypothetical protein